MVQSALERSCNGGRDSRGVPIHSHDGTQRLKPKRVAQPRQKLGSAVTLDNRFNDRGSELRHSIGKPLRHTAAMQRQISSSGTFHCPVLSLREMALEMRIWMK